DGHLLRAGQHGLVDVDGVDALERRGVAAAGQRATGADRVVARGAVRPEELATLGDAPLVDVLPVEVVLGRARGAGGQGGDVGGDLVDLLLRVLVLLARGLRRRLRHRHAAGLHLEADGGSADADQRGTVVAG